MTDYYEELKINKALSLEEISRELGKMESTWRRRELNSPEKAAKMLALILEAKDVFKNNGARVRYDQMLEAEKQIPLPGGRAESDRRQMNKWQDDAIVFFNSEQYDLALMAIDRALPLMEKLGLEDDSILNLAADIYKYNGDNQKALNLINRAILVNSEDATYYVIKASILANLGNIDQRRNNLKIALSKMEKGGNERLKAQVMGVYAYSLYFQYPINETQAEQYAREALKLGESLGNARAVLNAIQQAKEEEGRRKEEDEQIKREQLVQQEREAREERERQEELERERARQEEKQRRKKQIHKRCIAARNINLLVSVISVIAVAAVVVAAGESDALEDVLKVVYCPLYAAGSIIAYTLYRYYRALDEEEMDSDIGKVISFVSIIFEFSIWPYAAIYALYGNGINSLNGGSMSIRVLVGWIILTADTLICKYFPVSAR